MDWDTLRTFEAIARLGSLTDAARTLGVSQSTVSRHLRKLEDEAGSPLLLRSAPIRLTERGRALHEAILPMVDAALAAQTALDTSPALRGQVTLTTVGEWIRWGLVEHLPAFYQAHPHLRLRLLANNTTASLAADEADLAVRLARPERGDLFARKLGEVAYGLFAAAHLAPDPGMPWLGLAGSLGHIPEQSHAARVFGDRPARLLVEDVESLGLAVQAGLGAAFLPRMLASRLGGLTELRPAQLGLSDADPPPHRAFWLVVHRARRDLPRVRAVMDWLIDLYSRDRPRGLTSPPPPR